MLSPLHHGFEEGHAFTPHLRTVVAGLRWEPAQHCDGRCADLDLACFLLDREGRLIEAVHPGHARNVNASVVHTGDCVAGRGQWDDELLFVFLSMLPPAARTLAFVVSSATGCRLGDVQSASCHISDHMTEHAYLRADLAGHEDKSAVCVASLQRRAAGWELLSRERMDPYLSATVEMLAITACSKEAGTRAIRARA